MLTITRLLLSLHAYANACMQNTHYYCTKQQPFLTTFLRGIVCNWMVCMAVWVATGCSTLTEKYLAMVSSTTNTMHVVYICMLNCSLKRYAMYSIHVYAEVCIKLYAIPIAYMCMLKNVQKRYAIYSIYVCAGLSLLVRCLLQCARCLLRTKSTYARHSQCCI
jgi:Formate/nitrite transporter